MTATDARRPPFRAYRGTAPYVFVSYAHTDAPTVYPLLAWLRERGLNVWYDEGISPGERWHEEIAQAIEGANEFVLLVTRASVARPNCQREVNFALSREKPFVAVHLDDAALPAGMELAISDRQAILRTQLGEAAFRDRLLEHFSLAGAAEPERQSPAAPEPQSQKPPGARHRVPIAGGAVALSLIGLVAIWLSREQGPSQQEIGDQAQVMFDAGDAVGVWELLSDLDALDPTLADLQSGTSRLVNIRSDPSGAAVAWRRYGSDEPWRSLGTTPVLGQRLPTGFFEWRFTKTGYVTAVMAFQNPSHQLDNMPRQALSPPGIPDGQPPDLDSHRIVELRQVDGAPDRSVYVQPGRYRDIEANYDLSGYWIDRFETTNAEYQEFVDAGGYRDRQWWQGLRFEHEGRVLDVEQAMALMVDRTDRPGPAGWELGRHPPGREAHPVRGVSWYEATAYARFRDRQLPTSAHWRRAAYSVFELAAPAMPRVAEFGNFDQDDTWPVGGSAPSPVGAFDMGGNVREWVANHVRADGTRELRGGGHLQYFYMIRLPDTAPPLNRSLLNGIRLAMYEDDDALLAPSAGRPGRRDLADAEPLTGAAFDLLARDLTYEPTSFTPGPTDVDATNRRWVTETTTLPALDGSDMRVMIVRPHGPGPFQAVIYVPGIASLFSDTLTVRDGRVDPRFVVDSGRALVRPAWTGMYERRHGRPLPDAPLARRREYERQVVIGMRNELGQLIDYLQTRQDMDAERVALMAFSNGGQFIGAMHGEDRLDAVIMLSSGVSTLTPLQPMADAVHFLPRLTKPFLLLNGRQDSVFDYEGSQLHTIRLLGTPAEHVRHVAIEHAGHTPLPRAEVMREVADWLDRYLGPVR